MVGGHLGVPLRRDDCPRTVARIAPLEATGKNPHQPVSHIDFPGRLFIRPRVDGLCPASKKPLDADGICDIPGNAGDSHVDDAGRMVGARLTCVLVMFSDGRMYGYLLDLETPRNSVQSQILRSWDDLGCRMERRE
jgi:hypothetical protein